MRGALNVAIFTPKEAAEVLIGRERASAQERQMYAEALQSSDAGTIELSRGEKASRIKRLLAEASKETGVRVRSTWEDKNQRILLWKRVGS